MENKGSFYSGAFIMAGLIVLGLMLPLTAKVVRSFERTVAVKGLCEMEVKADKVIWPLVIKVAGDDLQSLYAQVNAKNKILAAFLADGGIRPEEISTTMTSSDKMTLEYNNDRANRYILTSIMTVCTDKVDEVLALQTRQSELLAKGVLLIQDDWNNKTIFSFEGLNDIKPGMIEKATANARASAEKFAQDSNSRLGKIKNATQGSFSITDRDANTPSIKTVRVVTSVSYYLSN